MNYSCALILALSLFSAPVQATRQRGSSTITVNRALTPFWACAEAHETVMFQASQSGLAGASLAFLPTSRVKISKGYIRYKEHRDYLVDRSTGRITLTQGSRIPFLHAQNLLTRGNKSSRFLRSSDHSDDDLRHDEGQFFPDHQVNLRYRHAIPSTRAAYPEYAVKDLPETKSRLAAGMPISILLLGDSISEGYNASGFIGFKPTAPSYPNQVLEGLRRSFGRNVTLDNRAHAGWLASQGLGQVINERLPDMRPDLVIIAYGMNDAVSVSPRYYGMAVSGIISAFQRVSPKTEFLLISPMLPNPNWASAPPARFFPLVDELARQTGDGVVLVDMTSLWAALLERKSFYDLTGNGINHPNDFGHSLYAQAILSTLVPADRLQSSAKIKCRN